MAKESTFKELAKDVLDMVIGECPIPNDEESAEINAEIARLEKEKEKVLIEKEKTDKMLNNPGFIEKAPTAKVEEEKEKQVKFNEMIKTIEERINKLK